MVSNVTLNTKETAHESDTSKDNQPIKRNCSVEGVIASPNASCYSLQITAGKTTKYCIYCLRNASISQEVKTL